MNVKRNQTEQLANEFVADAAADVNILSFSWHSNITNSPNMAASVMRL